MIVAQSASAQAPKLSVTASFTNKRAIKSTELIHLRLNRPLPAAEGSLAIFISQTDISSLFSITRTSLDYSPQALHLPQGENTLTVYLVSPTGEWKEVAKFLLHVEDDVTTSRPPVKTDSKWHGFDKFEVNPSLSLNLKSESTLLFFPDTNRPTRINFLDLALQGSLQTNLIRGSFSAQNQFDFVGTTYQKEALRFGDKSEQAPQIDLSSFLVQAQVKKIKFVFGHHAYGTNRYLIDNFSSRGINVSVPLGSRFDVSFNATNGTSIVGWNNFSGLGTRKHKVIAATAGTEIFPKHPGYLRLELGVLRGSLLPVNNFNRQNLTDAETSHGVGARVVATDGKGRLRLDAGFGRSRFNNPTDPLLDQGFSVVPVRETARNAQYVDFSYQLLKDWGITKDRKANLSFAFRHNRVDPLFRSVAVFTQADRLDNQFELTGSIGDITAGFVRNRLNDNLDDVPSILKTLTRRSGFNLGLPLASILGTAHEYSPWLPRLAFNFDRTHAFGAFLPTNSGFALSHVPDQASVNQSVGADWAHGDLRFGYRFNRSSQDNRQIGRQNADFRTQVNGLSFGFKPLRRLDLSFDFSNEHASNLEVNRLDRTNRVTFGSNFQTTKKSILALNVSSNLSGDAANISSNRSVDFDAQWSWRFGVEKDKYRKIQGQFFIKYTNRYLRAEDRLFLFHNLTKFQSVSSGLTLTFF
jgi:hypothetical protein